MQQKKHILNIFTPALLLDEAILDNNIQRMADYAASKNMMLRPHAKTPKSLPIVKKLLVHNACGITVSTLKEAEYFAENGINNIFYAVNMEYGKLERACHILKSGGDILFVTDSLEAIKQIGTHIKDDIIMRFLVEIDVDGYRTGVKYTNPEFLECVEYIHQHPNLSFMGIMSYAGASYQQKSFSDIDILTQKHRFALNEAKNSIVEHHIPCEMVSLGSTPAFLHGKNFDGITEMRCGIYSFWDLFQAGIGSCKQNDIAVSVLTSIIGKQPNYNRLIIDAGAFALSKDRSTQNHTFDAGYGLVCDINGNIIENLYVENVSQELGIVTTRDKQPIDFYKFSIGDKLRILPNHADPTVAAYSEYHVITKGNMIKTWDRINHW
jgi:D-serine deaminase-like pyridoxal phosphate-dependent protein